MTWDPVWEKLFSESGWGKYPSEPLIRFVARNFYSAPDRKAVHILELGCGPGPNIWYMAREGLSVYGIDGSETAIRVAQERLDHECPGWSGALRAADFLALPFDDSSFDAVIDHEAIYCNNFEDSQRIYREAWRVLRTNGKMFSRTFARGCIGEGTGQCLGRDYWQVADGPLSGKGAARFTGQDDIDTLLGPLHRTGLERVSYTINGLQEEVREWLIEAIKPPA